MLSLCLHRIFEKEELNRYCEFRGAEPEAVLHLQLVSLSQESQSHREWSTIYWYPAPSLFDILQRLDISQQSNASKTPTSKGYALRPVCPEVDSFSKDPLGLSTHPSVTTRTLEAIMPSFRAETTRGCMSLIAKRKGEAYIKKRSTNAHASVRPTTPFD